MALQISTYIPKKKIYVEPFSGLGRTAKYARSEVVILNDLSEDANKKCLKNFPYAVITNNDFEECIKKHDGEDTFFLIDPPYCTTFYNGEPVLMNKFMRKQLRNINNHYKSRKKKSSVIDRTAKEYLDKLQEILPTIKGHYILTLSLPKKFNSPYEKILRHIKPHLFGKHPSTHLYSNKPLEIQVPQIMDYV